MSAFFSQLKLAPQSTKTKISKALIELVESMKFFKSVEFDRVKLHVSDFKEDEIPAAQFIDVSESITHERNRVLRRWSISLEVIHKSSEHEYISQQDMWNIEYILARKLWSNPNLGIPGVIHAVYLSNSTDLHLLEPFYLLRLDFDVLYYEHLTSDC